MSDIVNAFKNKASQNVVGGKKKKTGLDLLNLDATDLRTETKKTEDPMAKALAASQKQNIQQDTNAGAKLNAEIAQNEYNKQVAQQQAAQQAMAKAAQATAQATKQSTYNAQNDDGWKKYYDAEFKKIKDNQNFFDRLLDNGQASRQAELHARNKYATELLDQAYDDDGNVLNQALADKAKQVSDYNVGIASRNQKQSQAISNAIGASKTSDTYGDNAWNNIRNTFNAIRLADLGSAVVGPDDTTKFEAADVGRFLVNLLPQAVPYLNVAYGVTRGLPTLGEAVTGYGKDSETGNYKKLDMAEILGKGTSGVIDVIAPFFGGSGDLMKTVGGRLFGKGAEKVAKEATKNVSTSALKSILKSFVEEGSEEGIQQAAEFFGDGNKLITKDGQFDGEAFKDLLGQSGKAALLGGISGSMMQGANIGLKKVFNNIDAQANNKKLPTAPNAGSVNENIDINENVETNEDVVTNTDLDENINENTDEVTTDTGETVKTKDIASTPQEKAVVDAKVNLDNAITKLKQTSSGLPVEYQTKIEEVSKQLAELVNSGRITVQEAQAKADQIQIVLENAMKEQVAVQSDASATGQPTNPNEVTAVQNAEGTQAADGVENTTGNTANDTVTEQEGMVQRDVPEYTGELSEQARAEQTRIMNELNNMGLTDEMISDIARSTGRNLRDIYALTKANTKGKFAIEKAKGDTNFLTNLIKKYLREGTFDTEIANYRQTMPSIYGEDGKIDWSSRTWREEVVDDPMYGKTKRMAKVDNPKLDGLMQKVNDLKQNGRISQDMIDYIKTEIASNKPTDEIITNIDNALAPRTAEPTIESMVETATEPEIDADFDRYAADKYGEMEMAGEELPGTPEPTIEEMFETASEPDENFDVTDTQGTKYEYDYANTASQYKERLDNTGMTPELLRKIYAERYRANTEGGKANLNEVLTKSEQDIAHKFFNEVAGDEKAGEKMYNDAYVTAQFEGTEYQSRALLELVDTGTLKDIYTDYNAMVTPEDFDASGNATVDYMIRRDKPDMLIQSAAQDLATDINPQATAEQVEAASKDIASAVKELNTKAKGSKDGSLGDAEIKSIKPVDKLSEAGKKLGVEKTVVKDAPRGLSDDVRLKNADQWYNNAYFGIFQNLNGFAQDTSTNVDNFIQNRFENLTEKQRTEILESRAKREAYFAKKFGDQKVAQYYTNRAMLKDAATQNLINYAMKTDFTNKKMQDLMNDYTTRYMLQDRYTQTVAQKLASGLQRVMNSSFRGMRVATTLNEIPEIVTSMADYKTLHTAKPGECQAIKAKYGMAQGGSLEQVLKTMDKADAKAFRAELEAAQDTNQAISVFKKWGKKISQFANSVDTNTQWNGFIQDWKDATFLKNAEAYYTAQGLSGFELKQRVLNDFEARMLPMSRVFKILKTDPALAKPLAMYVDSSLRLTRKAAKGAVGLNTAGVNENMGRGQRIARNAALDLLPRAISALVMGVPLASVIGLFQVGGEDYSGIPDEEKNELDVVLNFIGQLSPVLQLPVNYYNAYRQEEIGKEQYGDKYKDNRGDWVQRGNMNLLKTVTPLGNRLDQDWGLFGNTNNTKDVLSRGYAQNKQDKVQYLSPDNPVDFVRSLIGGVNRTSNAREYNNNPDLLSSIINQVKNNDVNNDGVTDGGLSEFFTENQALNSSPLDLGLKNDDAYNRPASDSQSHNYNEKIQKTTGDEQKMWYQKSREYNAILDNLRVNDKEAYDVYQDQYNNNYVSPERWRTVLYGKSTDGQPDLTVWNTMKELSLKAAKDFYGDEFQKHIDPAYTDLDDEQTRRYLQYKSTATGEDMALTKIMKTDPFWKEFYKKQNDYYDFDGEEDLSGKTDRVKQWKGLNKQYSAMFDWAGEDDPQNALDLRMNYPTMAAYNSLKKALQATYGEDYKSAPEYKQFFSDYGDAYNAESEAYNEQMLYIINQMRTIEGYDELTIEELETINNIGRSSSKSSSGSGSSSYSYVPFFENIFQADPVYTSVRKANKNFGYKKANGINFYDVPMSKSYGSDPYSSVV